MGAPDRLILRAIKAAPPVKLRTNGRSAEFKDAVALCHGQRNRDCTLQPLLKQTRPPPGGYSIWNSDLIPIGFI